MRAWISRCTTICHIRPEIEMTSEWDDFSQRQPHYDVALVVGERKFWISRGALATHSPVFAKMFYGQFQEARNLGVLLKDKRPEDILEMLRCLFPTKGYLKEVDIDNIVVLSKLADEYEILYLERQCAAALLSLREGDDRVLTLFTDAVTQGLKKIVLGSLAMVARFGTSRLRPFLEILPDKVRSAVLFQMAGQVNCPNAFSGQCNIRNDVAANAAKKGKFTGNVAPKSPPLHACITCTDCGRAKIWNRTAQLASQLCCRCVEALAAQELANFYD